MRGQAPAAPSAPQPAELSSAIEALATPLRRAASRPDNGWALAHGVLAFGPGFEASDGSLAVDRLAAFIETRAHGGRALLRFARERDGLPVEPHPHTVVRALLEAGVALDRPLGTRLGTPLGTQGARPSLRTLLSDLRASMALPTTDAGWHEVAWGMDALTLGGDAVPAVPGLREAALAYLEGEQKLLLESVEPAARALQPDTALGAARRAKREIFAHACGGLHLAQAVFRSVARDGEPDERRRAMTQLRAIARRFELERSLYASILRQRPDAALLISRQELKFFGHLAETLVTAAPLAETPADRQLLAKLRAETLVVLVASVRRLQGLNAYELLPQLETRDRQTYLDLIGDGCHALRALKLALE